MTKASMSLAELAEKGPDADLLRQMIQFVAQRLMDMDVETLCVAAYGERSAEDAYAMRIASGTGMSPKTEYWQWSEPKQISTSQVN